MRTIGTVTRLQIQRGSLKRGDKPTRVYDPAPLLSVPVLNVTPDGQERVRLKVLQVAHPCRPFTGWALGKTVEPEELKKHLQFLDGGMRGFYCVGEGTGTVSLGDSVAVL